jgi:hypothetical protein
MNAQELAPQIEKSRDGEPLALRLSQGRVAESLMHTGRLRWRFLVLIVLLGAVAVPLKKAFVQVAGEAVARSAVQQVVKHLLPPGALVSQQVDVEPGSISIRLFATEQVSEDKQREAEQSIQQRSGRSVSLSVASVASQSELAHMMERLNATPVMPPPAPPAVETIDELRAKLLGRISQALTAIWPTEIPLSGFEVDLSDNAVIIDAQYESDRDLSPIALGVISKQLQVDLKLPTLVLNARRARGTGRRSSQRKAQTR